MRVKLERPGQIGEIASFLASCDCSVRQTAVDVLEIGFSSPVADHGELDRVRLEAYLGVWNALHPGAPAVVMDDVSRGLAGVSPP